MLAGSQSEHLSTNCSSKGLAMCATGTKQQILPRCPCRVCQPSSSQTPLATGGQTPGWQENLDAATAVVIHVQSACRNKKLGLAYM